MIDYPQIITANAVGLMLMLILLMHMRGRTRSALVGDRLFVIMVYLTAVLCVLAALMYLGVAECEKRLRAQRARP